MHRSIDHNWPLLSNWMPMMVADRTRWVIKLCTCWSENFTQPHGHISTREQWPMDIEHACKSKNRTIEPPISTSACVLSICLCFPQYKSLVWTTDEQWTQYHHKFYLWYIFEIYFSHCARNRIKGFFCALNCLKTRTTATF